jgi:hypothetical protein
MIKVMFIVLGELSSGELTIAHSFASRLPEDKFQTLFLSVDKHKKYLDDRGVSNIVLSEADGIYTNRMKIDRIIKTLIPIFSYCQLYLLWNTPRDGRVCAIVR